VRQTATDRIRATIGLALVSNVRVTFGPAHDVVRIWNRGGLAGELTMRSGDGEPLARRLLCPPLSVERSETEVTLFEADP
jgi:hypothetical protein